MKAGNFPTAPQEDLLAAALEPPDRAFEAWRGWRATDDFDTLDWGGYRLFPLIYRRLSQVAPDDPDVRTMANIYRHTWYRNQMLFKHAGELVDRLHEAGVPTLLLKGAAMTALHYRDAGVRPMEDVDVLVPTAQAHQAIALLTRAGWTSESGRPHERVAVHHAEGFESGEGGAIDLHWHALYEPADEQDFWDRAVPATISGTATLGLAPADQLLHACVHGRPRNHVPTIRWVADAVTISRDHPGIDWERLVDRARDRRLTLPLTDALRYLASRWEVPVPPETIHALETAPTSAVERSAYRAAVNRPPPSPARAVAVFWERYRRLEAFDPPYATPTSFHTYLRQTYGFVRPWDFPVRAARRAAAAVSSPAR